MRIVQLLASPFLGGPERQVLGLASSLPAAYRTVFLSFPERGLSQPFLQEAGRLGFEAVALRHNSPHVRLAVREVADQLRRIGADVLCCNGYKPDVVGWLAAQRVGVPIVSVAHGWTAATFKVRVYEALDRFLLRWMDAVVCVSAGQAEKVRRAGVPPERALVIRNGVRFRETIDPDATYRRLLHSFFPQAPARVVGAAGRLSPEKGFGQLVEAAALVARDDADVGFIHFGEGPLREDLRRQIAARGLERRFILAGFRTDLEKFLPHFDLAVLPSFTEGLPVIVLEAFAAGVPVVATAVGGTPEVVEDGVSGFLVPPGEPAALAARIRAALADEVRRRAMGACGRQRVREQFTFDRQSEQYQELFERLTRRRQRARAA